VERKRLLRPPLCHCIKEAHDARVANAVEEDADARCPVWESGAEAL
jgi:hypothetical protein